MSRGLLAALVCSIALVEGAHAQASRTWVSGVGDDANPCSRTAPCKTFAGAISKTAAGGEINALDPGGYGAVTITKSITIDGTGTMASVLVSGTNAIVINAATTNNIILRNIEINGLGSGLEAVRILSAKSVRLENVTIFGFAGRGISIQPSAASPMSVTVRNTSVRNGGGIGVVAQSSVANVISLLIEGSIVDGNASHGMWATNGAKVSIFDSTFANNGIAGFIVTGANTRASIHASSFVNNLTGIQAGNGAAETSVITLSNSLVSGNGTGVNIAGGTVETIFNNAVRNNTTNIGGGAMVSVGPQ